MAPPLRRAPKGAYLSRCDSAAASLQWVEQRDGEEIVYDREPRAGFALRAFVGMLSMLPIEWLL